MHWWLSQVRVEIESLAEGVDLSEPLTRARFEELNNDLFKKTLTPVRKARPPPPSRLPKQPNSHRCTSSPQGKIPTLPPFPPASAAQLSYVHIWGSKFGFCHGFAAF